ncbi:YihY/virulence factor BrkB family protein [uncultured Agrococcus sp.]|uniref:YihY/virulence factor BrkB family protein n=1 Tax=uncultured Agrococcus sp. TaxID=382258 RepID=UPI0025F9A8A4|nr:YihY/virulence factor BrkB family protein [uncultured Agrococcus sp.]
MQIIDRVKQLRPVRAWNHYSERDGVVYAQSMTLSGFFSIFAGLFIAFAVFMQILGGNRELLDTVIESISGQIPGLIRDGDGNGVIDPDALIDSRITEVAGIIAAVGIVMTATRWIANSRLGFRAMLDLPTPSPNFVVLKLGDLGVAIGIGLLILISSGTLIASQTFAAALGLGGFSWLLGILVQLALDTAIVLLMFRFAGHIKLPLKYLVGTAFVVAIAFLILKTFASLLFGSVSNNPLLTSIASVFVILIWLGFIHQIYLIALSFIAVGNAGERYSELEHHLTQERKEAVARKKEEEALRERELERVREELAAIRGRESDPKKLAKNLKKQQKKLRG